MKLHDYMHNKVKLSKKSWIAMLFGILFASGVFGFIYETIFYIFNNGMLTRRGTCFGPWVQIYCFGGIIIFLTCYWIRKRPWLVFIVSGAVCTALEYGTGYAMFHGGGPRSWDYNTEILNFGNVNGYICLRASLVFAAAGLLLIYVIIPMFLKLHRAVGERTFCLIMFLIGGICLADIIYNEAIAKAVGSLDAVTFYGRSGWYPLVTGYTGG